MGLFKSQLSNVVEWEEYKDDCIFWKWTNKEIKKGSRLIIRPGQDACRSNHYKGQEDYSYPCITGRIHYPYTAL